MITTLCRGMSYALSASPMTCSLSPVEYVFAVSHVFRPRWYAAYRSACAASPLTTQSTSPAAPSDMAPRIGTDMRRPDLPRCV